MRPIVLLVLLTAACRPADIQPASEQEVRDFLVEFAADAATSDADLIARNYTEDVRILEDGRVADTSRQAVHDAIASFPVQGSVTLEFEDTRVLPAGPDAAHVQTLFSQRFEGSDLAFSGAISMHLVKQGGTWLIARSHTSTSRPRQDFPAQ
ncbi:MAG: DUF4440 domain-containing protein [Rhodothermales bacterium]|nr:DUF4440 domain-containing protein [Rhodothermales bacterium]MBO6781105.1 DUF4440 domain-containing protein [Rhodothermales bacterium]